MARLKSEKTSFAGGEISPQLLGRSDLRVFANGARKLRNVFLEPTGGVCRRQGLRYIDTAFGRGRLVAFEFNTEQVYLLVFADRRIDVYRDGGRVASFATPWQESQIAQINWTQSADTLLVVHPDVAPRKITRSSDSVWDLVNWSFNNDADRVHMPHHKFVDAAVTLQASGTTGSVLLTASASVFAPEHMGVRLRIADKEVQVSAVISSTQVQAMVKQTLTGTTATADWSEQAFSSARGYPVSVCFHQDRLVVGGSRDLPNRLWLSRSADLFNFDPGDGLDDEAIEFPLLSDQVNAIRHVFSGRHLQVFTSGAEWMVTGEPLTPTNIQLFRQTRVGSPVDRSVPLRDVDGATVFIPRCGQQLREFLFTDTEQAYRSADLAMLAHHVMDRPVDMDFDEARRLLHVVMSNGRLATLTAFRDEEVNGWTIQETRGRFLSVAVVGEQTYALIERDAGVFIERFAADLQVDAGLSGEGAPQRVWAGADHLEGMVVKVVADGIVQPDATVTGGNVTIDHEARSVQLGLPFAHVIEPLPPQLQGVGTNQGVKVRAVSLNFRLWQTAAMFLDTGRGPASVPLQRFDAYRFDAPVIPYDGDVTVRVLGWRDGGIQPLWRIEQDIPLPFTLLSVSTDLSVN